MAVSKDWKRVIRNQGTANTLVPTQVPRGRIELLAREGWQPARVERLTAASATAWLYNELTPGLDEEARLDVAIDYAAARGLDVSWDGERL